MGILALFANQVLNFYKKYYYYFYSKLSLANRINWSSWNKCLSDSLSNKRVQHWATVNKDDYTINVKLKILAICMKINWYLHSYILSDDCFSEHGSYAGSVNINIDGDACVKWELVFQLSDFGDSALDFFPDFSWEELENKCRCACLISIINDKHLMNGKIKYIFFST